MPTLQDTGTGQPEVAPPHPTPHPTHTHTHKHADSSAKPTPETSPPPGAGADAYRHGGFGCLGNQRGDVHQVDNKILSDGVGHVAKHADQRRLHGTVQVGVLCPSKPTMGHKKIRGGRERRGVQKCKWGKRRNGTRRVGKLKPAAAMCKEGAQGAGGGKQLGRVRRVE
jgi:hypothetical protein